MNRDQLGVAAGLGAVTGMRSLTGLAMVSRELSDRRRLPRHASRLEEWLAEDLVAIALSGLALGELVVDKVPGVPDRIRPSSLLGRGLIGSLLGAIAAGRDDRALGAAVGGAAAVVASFAAWFARAQAARITMLPDPALALAEDALALAAAREVAREL